jgi:hypothetical protein
VGKSVGKRQLGRRRHRWEDNIVMDLQEMGWDGMDGWMDAWMDGIGIDGGLL